MHNISVRPKKNKSKTVYRNLFYLFVGGLFVYFWKFVNQTLDQSVYAIIFCFLFLMGISAVLGWRMYKEPDFKPDSNPKKPDAETAEEIETEKTK